MHLYEALAGRVEQWKAAGYPHADFPSISEILEWAADPEGPGFRLRPPQVRALETYWHLRLVLHTPHIFDLYQSLFPRNTELLEALGLIHSEMRDIVLDEGREALFARIRSDDDFVRRHALRPCARP
jgi:hypothetical protein